ncbi:MAG: hypothetical protein IJQ84_08345 [Paludibacteraceae bacterium]|nr:hypothetical protein [Paludibacteraceae bacterium]
MKKVYFQPNVQTDACVKGQFSFMSKSLPANPDSGLPELAPGRKVF